MTGTKATWLHELATQRGRGFIRFDYRGHGQSSGDFLELGISDWVQDASQILQLSKGPQILVGSSMGGWIALLLARRHPDRIAGLIGIAAAPDFTQDLMWARFSEDQRAALMEAGRIDLPSEYDDGPYPITRHLIQDGRTNLVLQTPLRLPFPVRLLHGTADDDVPHSLSTRLIEHADCPDMRLTLVKGADHRFSGPAELDLLGRTLDEIA